MRHCIVHSEVGIFIWLCARRFHKLQNKPKPHPDFFFENALYFAAMSLFCMTIEYQDRTAKQKIKTEAH
jgi:hypothetical protein